MVALVAHGPVLRAPQIRVGGEVVNVAAARSGAVAGRTHRAGSLTMRWSADVGLR
jgi:hypothetical protein